MRRPLGTRVDASEKIAISAKFGSWCNRLWVLKNSFSGNSLKTHCVRMRYKRLSRLGETFSIPRLVAVFPTKRLFQYPRDVTPTMPWSRSLQCEASCNNFGTALESQHYAHHLCSCGPSRTRLDDYLHSLLLSINATAAGGRHLHPLQVAIPRLFLM